MAPAFLPARSEPTPDRWRNDWHGGREETEGAMRRVRSGSCEWRLTVSNSLSVQFCHHPDAPLSSFLLRRRFSQPTPERVLVANHQSGSRFCGTDRGTRGLLPFDSPIACNKSRKGVSCSRVAANISTHCVSRLMPLSVSQGDFLGVGNCLGPSNTP